MVKELREKCGAGIMDCRNALISTGGDMDKAADILKEKGLLKAQKKMERVASQGLIESYIHAGGRVGTIIELNCETDFVARTEEFKQLAHELAMQVTAMAPSCVNEDELPRDEGVEPEAACLLLQPYIKDPTRTIKDLITETIARVGENIKVRRFTRFELGS
jgi:elongation factor Ts